MKVLAVATIAAVATVVAADYKCVPNPPAPSYDCPASAVACTNNPLTGLPYDSCCVADQGLMVFAQNWTAGYCLSSAPNHYCAPSTLSHLPDHKFTVHGLWPDYCNGSYSNSDLGCDPTRRYTDVPARIMGADSDLYGKLQKMWMGADGSYDWFWSHEFVKHGTCDSQLNPKCYTNYKPNEEIVDYTRRIYSLWKEFDLFAAFKKHGIVPSNTTTYKFSAMQAALKAEFGYEGAIQCVTDSQKNKYLSEIWMYLMNVAGNKFIHHEPVAAYNGCLSTNQTDADIYYPPQPSRG
ncbi:ribonuclease T2-like protein [Polychytrium aggregatum]|uniref:ribonuclease T2-like protein n=1 Tax=Polychytrium aggregatum TaxID=110093 RepID=UPI0022FE7A66|nr:ribonuclease T2-like protein [Polychytrium aggregatum]KAI9197458.1 ribonuclease T2-like protein [Polychytrium aggregatum]